MLEAKQNTRILDDRERRTPDMIDPAVRQVVGGMLVQDRDYDLEERSEMQVVSKRRSHRGRVGRAAVRLEGLQARPLERHRARPGTSRRSGSARAR